MADQGSPRKSKIVVAFLYAGRIPREVAQIMVASVKRTMPDARVVQMTDYHTKPILGVDDVMRKHWNGQNLMPYRFLHMKEFPLDQTIFLDYDVVVRKDLSALFAEDFDVALTRRDETDWALRNSPLVRDSMPYNTGVMLSRASGRGFWEEAYQMCLRMPDSSQGWWGDQLAIKELAQRTTLKVKEFPCDLYNYSPDNNFEDLGGKYVVHYKGKLRKAWMLAQWSALLPAKGRR